MLESQYDYLIVGGGIVGLTIALTIAKEIPEASICVLEKEKAIGLHASGRNSGVLHSGIYYPENSLKGKLCADGAMRMANYCEEKDLPINRIGKLILPKNGDNIGQLEILLKRGSSNGAKVFSVDASEIREIEPEASTEIGTALYLPNTAVIDPLLVLESIKLDLVKKGVVLKYECRLSNADPDKNIVFTGAGEAYKYGVLVNATGQHSDRVSNIFQMGKEFTILPFRGSYYKLAKNSNIKINGLIYPLPDLDLPFLGVHSVKTISDDVYFGPTALPAFGRENYEKFSGFELRDVLSIGYQSFRMYIKDSQGFRKHTHQEILRISKHFILSAAQDLVPNIKSIDLISSNKVGIRAQLVNKKERKLEMDFIVRKTNNTVHILNAVSPAFTSAFAMSEYVFDKYIK